MASAYSTKGTKVCVLKGSATATSLVPTAITQAAPAVVTVASVTGITKGDMITIADAGTGFPGIDGKTWIVGDVNTVNKTFQIVGSDTTSGGTLVGSPVISHYPNTTSMLCLCLSTITFNPEAANTVSVATFCDPTATIPSQVIGAGTIDIGGYVDITDAGYKELTKAENDGIARKWRVSLGNDQGYVLFDGILSTLSLDLPIDGASAYAGTVTLSSKYRHLF